MRKDNLSLQHRQPVEYVRSNFVTQGCWGDEVTGENMRVAAKAVGEPSACQRNPYLHSYIYIIISLFLDMSPVRPEPWACGWNKVIDPQLLQNP